MLDEQIMPPQSGNKPTSAVIILHGLGDSGEGILTLADAWRRDLPDTVFLAPNAPYPCDMAPFGYQWFSLIDRSMPALKKGVINAAPFVNDYIDHVMQSYDLPIEKIALVGFSQGTMMSLYIAPRRTQTLAGVLGYSGALIGGEDLLKERQSNPPFMLAHGKLDDVVPFSALHAAKQGLENANLNVSILECPNIGHNVDERGLMDGLAFLRKVLNVL